MSAIKDWAFDLKIFLMGIPVCIGVGTLVSGIFERLKHENNQQQLSGCWLNDFRIFSIITGFTVSFAVITTVQTKLMWYILYIYPFAALITGALTANIITVIKYRNRTC